MIPILYEANETAFLSNGLGRLSDAITCKVTEQRNATYELEITYPINGIHFSDITENRIILAKPFEGGQTQPFIIYRIEKPINGICTIKAEHISYRLSSIVVMPFKSDDLTEALTDISNYSASANPFTITSDITSAIAFENKEPKSAREILGGSSGSILDIYGRGDYEFNRFDVILHANRGQDAGVTLRYGKNITDLKSVLDATGVYTGIVPFWTDGEDNTVVLPEKIVLSSHASEFPYNIIKAVDFSADFEEAPTVSQLRDKATAYVTKNEGWKIKNNITVSFVDLWNTEEYKNIAPLERVQLCDTVHVIYNKLGVDFTTKVIQTEYNVLEERYNKITLGDTYYSLSSVWGAELEQSEEKTATHMQKAIDRATKLIQGGLGGHVVFNVNADGEPEEILIMDTDDIQTAVNVIRFNLNGIGFSKTGYNGTYTTAWTIDGHFVANFIDTGTLNASIIKAGVLQDENGTTQFNLATGALYSENLTIDSTYFKLSNTGKITSINADGHIIEIDEGVITGYRDDGVTISSQLEVGNGYFNIIGKLALNGVVGVSGNTSFVKGLDYEEQTLANVVTSWETKKVVTGVDYIMPSVSVTGNASGTVTVSGTIDGQPVTLTGYNSLPISASVNVTGGRVDVYKDDVPVNPQRTNLKYLKAVSAADGTIKSADGLIQTIT